MRGTVLCGQPFVALQVQPRPKRPGFLQAKPLQKQTPSILPHPLHPFSPRTLCHDGSEQPSDICETLDEIDPLSRPVYLMAGTRLGVSLRRQRFSSVSGHSVIFPSFRPTFSTGRQRCNRISSWEGNKVRADSLLKLLNSSGDLGCMVI